MKVYRIMKEGGGFEETTEKPGEGVNYEVITIEPFQEDSLIKSQEYLKEVNLVYESLMFSALSRSIGKTGTRAYLEAQREEYKDKYECAKGLVENPFMEVSIRAELDRDFPEDTINSVLEIYGLPTSGTRLERMKRLIVFRYEYGNQAFLQFKAFIADFRTKCITYIELQNFEKVDEIIDLAKSITGDTTNEEIFQKVLTFNDL